MKVAAVQMVSTPQVDRNLQAAARLLAQAARAGARLALLPEYFCLMGRRDGDKFDIAEAPGDGPIQRFLAEQAREHRLWLIGGTCRCANPAPSVCATAAWHSRPMAGWRRATTRSICSRSTTAASATTRAVCSNPAATRSRCRPMRCGSA